MERNRGQADRRLGRSVYSFLRIHWSAGFTVTQGVNHSRETRVGQKETTGLDVALLAVYPVTPGGPLVTKGAISLPNWSVDLRSGDRAETRRTTSQGSGAPSRIPGMESPAPRISMLVSAKVIPSCLSFAKIASAADLAFVAAWGPTTVIMPVAIKPSW